MSEFVDLSAATAGVYADLAAPEATPGAETPATPVVTPPVATPVSETPDVETPAPAAPTEEELELKYNGQPLRLPRSEVISLAQQGHDYTQKTMALATQRREVEAMLAQAQQKEADLQAVLTDKEKLKQLVQWAASEQQVAPEDPDTVMTASQVEAMLQSRVQDILKTTRTEIAKSQFDLETTRLENEYTATINGHLSQILKTNPILAEVEGIEGLLKSEAATHVKAKVSANPTVEIPLAETLGFLSKAAERRAAKLEAAFEGRMKTKAVKQATLVQTGIEPAGASAPVPTAGKPPRLGSMDLRNQAIADVEAVFRR